MNIDVLSGVMIPFFGTTLGASLVLFMKREFNFFLEDFLTAMSGGIMTAASVWSLIIPAVENSEHLGRLAFLPCCVGMGLGCGFMIALSEGTRRLLAIRKDMPEYKNLSSVIAVTIHNIPEGMAVGCVYAAAIGGEDEHLYAVAIVLSLGIAVQNIPEGAVISMPLYAQGLGKTNALITGALSGVVEPLGALTALFMSKIIGALLPYFLAFAAGTMLFVVSQEMLSESKYKGKLPVTGIAFTLGFMVMMSLDVALA